MVYLMGCTCVLCYPTSILYSYNSNSLLFGSRVLAPMWLRVVAHASRSLASHIIRHHLYTAKSSVPASLRYGEGRGTSCQLLGNHGTCVQKTRRLDDVTEVKGRHLRQGVLGYRILDGLRGTVGRGVTLSFRQVEGK